MVHTAEERARLMHAANVALQGVELPERRPQAEPPPAMQDLPSDASLQDASVANRIAATKARLEAVLGKGTLDFADDEQEIARMEAAQHAHDIAEAHRLARATEAAAAAAARRKARRRREHDVAISNHHVHSESSASVGGSRSGGVGGGGFGSESARFLNLHQLQIGPETGGSAKPKTQPAETKKQPAKKRVPPLKTDEEELVISLFAAHKSFRRIKKPKAEAKK
jgi:hypothetical protein